jgi:hypothetical protein
MPKTNWNLLIAVLVLALAGCAPLQPGPVDFPSPPPSGLPTVATATPLVIATQGTDTQTPAPLPTQGDQTQMPDSNPALTPVLQNLVNNARQDLAKMLNTSETGINLSSATEVTWPDSSLGCPKMGFAYSQVITPGYRIVFEYGNKKYEYHANRTTYFVYCKNPSPPFTVNPANF